jgi:GT2 family glycosyltransferase
VESLFKSTIQLSVHIYCNSSDEAYGMQLKDALESFGSRLKLHLGMENKGFGHGHNVIVEHLADDFDWYVCCNPDIRVFSDTIENLIRFGETHPDSIILGPKILGVSGQVESLARQNPTLPRWVQRQLWRVFPNFFRPFEVRFDYNSAAPIEFVSGCFFLIRKEHYRLLGGFSKEFFLYYEDADFSRKASQIGNNYYVANASVIHLWQKAWTGSFRMSVIHLRSLLTYFNRWGWF